MVAWALSALQAQTPELWAAQTGFVAACPPDSLDEARRAGGWVGAACTPSGLTTPCRRRPHQARSRAAHAASGTGRGAAHRCKQ